MQLTIHSAKGLEFPVVFVVGLRKGVIPFSCPDFRSTSDKKLEIERQRNLLYVAMARAYEHLYLLTSGQKSPFREEIIDTVVKGINGEERLTIETYGKSGAFSLLKAGKFLFMRKYLNYCQTQYNLQKR